jgi:hypothetical protein
MNVCQECGSISRDKSGICSGCGAAWPLATPVVSVNRDGSEQVSPLANLPGKINSIGLVEVRPKLVWGAVLLALACGPLGLLYCTVTGAMVMLIVSLALLFFLGQASFLIVLPICAIWAWRAARESTSLFD